MAAVQLMGGGEKTAGPCTAGGVRLLTGKTARESGRDREGGGARMHGSCAEPRLPGLPAGSGAITDRAA